MALTFIYNRNYITRFAYIAFQISSCTGCAIQTINFGLL